MFENITVDEIRENMMAQIPDTMDKRPSSLIYTVLSAVALEYKQLLVDADYILTNAFADTADRQHLITIAKEMSVVPTMATPTIVEAIFNIDCPQGTRFNAKGYLFWLSKPMGLGEDGYYHAELTCEMVGALPNDPYLGRLVPVDGTGQVKSISGLEKAEIIKTLKTGENEEETEAFRKHYFDATKWEHYGGNIADYKMMMRATPGAGGVKVIPAWNGGGTVKLIITSSTHDVPSPEFLAQVKEKIDPIGFEGRGYGQAPIDHKVTIEGAQAVAINVDLNVTYEPDQSWESLQKDILAVVEGYLAELRAKWEMSDGLIVRTAYIESRILDIPGVKDVRDTLINGSRYNIELGSYELPILGVVKEAVL